MTGLDTTYLSVARYRPRRLREVMLRGQPPTAENLVGWEYRGINLPATSALIGLRRFIKGFTAGEASPALGYNKLVKGTDLTSAWIPTVRPNGRAAYAPFAVGTVDPESTDNRFLNALLLDYSAAPVPERGVAARLRDYIVRVVPGSDDILLGQAFMALGRARIPLGWFVLERLGPADPT